MKIYILDDETRVKRVKQKPISNLCHGRCFEGGSCLTAKDNNGNPLPPCYTDKDINAYIFKQVDDETI